MKTDVFNIKGDKVGSVDLKDEIFSYPWNEELVHQVVVSLAANRRRPWAHTKDRGDVRGGGKKPWRQKGTGRARHGSIRSPIWAGGGVTHGPNKEKDYSKKINKKMMRAAVHSALSRKLADGELKVIDSLSFDSGKTKELVGALNGFFKTKTAPSTLLVTGKENKAIVRASNNLAKVAATGGVTVSVEDLMKHKNILIEQSAIEEIK